MGRFFYQKGEVSIFGTRNLVLPIYFLVKLLKGLEKNLGYEPYRKIIFELGVDFGVKNVGTVKSEFKLKEDPLLLSTIRYVAARGYGKLLGIAGALASGKVIIRIRSSLAEFWGKSDKPVDVLYEGGFLGMVEEITGRRWNCKETKCIVMGDDHCEFELTQIY